MSYLTAQSEVQMLLPTVIGDYTDFFSSMHHAKNCGTIFRGPENPVPANWYLLFILNLFTLHPYGYHII